MVVNGLFVGPQQHCQHGNRRVRSAHARINCEIGLSPRLYTIAYIKLIQLRIQSNSVDLSHLNAGPPSTRSQSSSFTTRFVDSISHTDLREAYKVFRLPLSFCCRILRPHCTTHLRTEYTLFIIFIYSSFQIHL